MGSAANHRIEPLPSESSARLVSLDFIRGIAVMGILGANIVAFGQPFVAYFWPGGFATPPEPADRWLWTAQFLLIDGKMRGLFTLLFGAGLALFADRAAARGASGWLQVRRLGWLFAFGLVHFYLIWRGDILTLYALCGLIALLAVRLPPVQQAAIGASVYLVGALIGTAMLGASLGSPDAPSTAIADGLAERAIAEGGSYFDYLRHAAGAHRWNWTEVFAYSLLETIPLMLIGMALYRFGVFSGAFAARSQARWGWAGIVAGTLLTGLLAAWTLKRGLTYAGTLFAIEGAGALARFPVVLGLAALIAAWAPRATGGLGSRIVAAGRMAFSNYLGTSIIMLFVFQPAGLRLFGILDRPKLYLIMLAVWALILLWSKPWLSRFRHGPLEWLWRSLTYGRVLPLRR